MDNILNSKFDFLVKAYIRIMPEDLSDLEDSSKIKNIVLKCSEKSYQDLKRNIPYKYSLSERHKISPSNWNYFSCLKQKFIKEVNNLIYKGIVDDVGKLSCATIEPLNMIKQICDLNTKYKGLFKDKKHITVGIAQKWVNMALKYLWILGIYDEKYSENLEIPIDGIILKEMELDYRSLAKIAWSKWDDINEYKEVQKLFKKICQDNNITRIAWENSKWIATFG